MLRMKNTYEKPANSEKTQNFARKILSGSENGAK